MIWTNFKKKVNTKKNKYQTKRFWAGFLLAQILLFFMLSKIGFAVELFARFFELKKRFHQQLFARIPFSVGDVFYIVVFIFLGFILINTIRKVSRNKSLIWLFVAINSFYFIYQLFWGMMYFQHPIREKLPKGEVTAKQTKELALIYLDRCRKTRELVSEDGSGVFEIENFKEVETEILRRQKHLPKIIGSQKWTAINSFKPSLFRGIMSYTGIFGYYNPFSAEAQINAELPSIFLPFTLAHESSHQLGFAREQEANFVGYLIGKESGNSDLRYSTEYFVLKSLLNALAEKNPAFVKQVLSAYSPGMKRDRNAEKAFIKNHAGILDSLFGITNDLFLKSNQQDGSVTYSYFVNLLIQYEYSTDRQ